MVLILCALQVVEETGKARARNGARCCSSPTSASARTFGKPWVRCRAWWETVGEPVGGSYAPQAECQGHRTGQIPARIPWSSECREEIMGRLVADDVL